MPPVTPWSPQLPRAAQGPGGAGRHSLYWDGARTFDCLSPHCSPSSSSSKQSYRASCGKVSCVSDRLPDD
ncbi:hypothetical protein [Oryza sativa Japonica Group]|uniref:Uncharacterized protein n=1 Tax=Oryza sativa subsp. japonica TaxID=39947 RepID=Q5JKU7_ORYSJ|nr:hypothetical protein [Oryza sativa Japonica Group]